MAMEQGVVRTAGFGIRLGAQLIDSVILGIPYALGYFLFTENLSLDIAYDVFALFYSIALPILWNGQTIGKKVLGIRIKKLTGEKIGLGTMLLRTLVAGLIYGITLGIAFFVSFLMVVFRKDKRSLHDLVAGTYVGRD